MANVKDTASFIDAARAIHGDRYDYSQTVYVGSQSPVTIVCRVCGPFTLAEAAAHYKTCRKPSGCVRCNLAAAYKKRWGREVSPMQKFHGFVDSTQRFIDASKAIHGDRYDYSLSVFISSERRIAVICREHGAFEIRADSHYRKGCGCRQCGMAARKHRGRVYKTCKCGFVGHGVKQFPHAAKGKCAKCWSKITGRAVKVQVRDKWDQWANTQGSEFFRYQKKKIARYGAPWDHWATSKAVVICNRKKIKHGKPIADRRLSTWHAFSVVAIQKLKQRHKYNEMNQWERKCCSWMRSLKMRARAQQGASYAG